MEEARWSGAMVGFVIGPPPWRIRFGPQKSGGLGGAYLNGSGGLLLSLPPMLKESCEVGAFGVRAYGMEAQGSTALP